MRGMILALLSFLLVSCPLCLRVLSAAAAERPNILLIVSDDQGWPDLGCIGTKPIQTPHLDRLAKEGVRLTNYYVTWPACTPSRGSILTGRHPLKSGLYDMVRNDLVNYGHRYTEQEYSTSPEMTIGLDPREKTLGDVLRAAGYRCGMVGKWDMGQARRYLPLQRGFDFSTVSATTGSTTTRTSGMASIRCSPATSGRKPTRARTRRICSGARR